MTARPDRLFRPTPSDKFPSWDIVAVLDSVENVVLFNQSFLGDHALERRALCMEVPVLRLNADDLAKLRREPLFAHG